MTAQRSARRGSLWEHRDFGYRVRVVSGRHGFVLAIRTADRNTGYAGPVEDFRASFKWLKGR